ncbi:hypothetical protein HNY73_021380 [Argiope bruennichi]|uniref:Uncharacterized protein n=1 Tax=Argiope bruennichi TaxID=94029 RepID=A0A8T0DYD7_ARGBR|nr:hypothetical protein HNY73_021380 [Argiope bruennichi]
MAVLLAVGEAFTDELAGYFADNYDPKTGNEIKLMMACIRKTHQQKRGRVPRNHRISVVPQQTHRQKTELAASPRFLVSSSSSSETGCSSSCCLTGSGCSVPNCAKSIPRSSP